MYLSFSNFVPEHRVLSQDWYIRHPHPACYTNFVQVGVFRVTIRLRRDHVLRSNIGFTHASIRPICISTSNPPPPLIHNRAGCAFRLLPVAKEVSLPEKDPSDLCRLIDSVIVMILSVGEPSLNDSI